MPSVASSLIRQPNFWCIAITVLTASVLTICFVLFVPLPLGTSVVTCNTPPELRSVVMVTEKNVYGDRWHNHNVVMGLRNCSVAGREVVIHKHNPSRSLAIERAKTYPNRTRVVQTLGNIYVVEESEFEDQKDTCYITSGFLLFLTWAPALALLSHQTEKLLKKLAEAAVSSKSSKTCAKEEMIDLL